MGSGGKGTCRVAIVGAGYVSQHHIQALRTLERVEIVAIADVNLRAAEAMAARFGIPLVGSNLAEIASSAPDAVYVLTPPSTHCALTLAALDLGCHVFVEKPMAETVADCDLMIAKAKERGLMLSVNHSDRLDPSVVAALDKVRKGVCGDLVAVDFIRGSDYAPYAGGPRTGPYRKGSYPFQDIGVHGLYLLEAFLGPIKQLQIDYRSVLGGPYFLFDDWYASALCEKGVGRLHLSWVARPMQSRLIIQGTRGTIEIDRFLQTTYVSRLLPGPKFVGMVVNALRGALSRFFWVIVNVARFALKRLPPSPGIYAGAIDFAQAVLNARPPAVSADEGRRMVALMLDVCERADAEAEQIIKARYAPLAPVDALVTGAGGFLGSALVKRLHADGQTIRVLVRRQPHWAAQLPGVQFVIGDLGDPEIVAHAVAGARTVYHVGAAMRGGAESYRAGTTEGVRNVIDACLRHATPRLVYVSSLSVMDHAGRPADLVLREDAPYEPQPNLRGLYTQTKLDAERAVLDAMANRGLPAVVLRPGQIFGPGAENVTPNGVVALAGRWLLVGNGTLSLPLVYLDDVVDALLIAGRREGVSGKTFNLVDTASVTQNAYLAAYREKMRGAAKITRVPVAFMMTMAWGVEQLGKVLRREVPLSRYRVRSLRPLANFDVTAASTVLDWQPRVGVLEGLSRTFGAKPKS
jgi:2-alkyl-3-oxoalkanoate reductase